MTYVKQTWENLPDQSTPITAERLSHMETQYDEALSGLGVFNVMDYGAVGDGTANDQAALQGALDAAYAAGGGEVIVPAGHVYMIASQVIIRSNTILTMYGAELKKPAGASFPWFRNFQSGVDNFPGYTGHGNIIVRGGTINGQAHLAPDPSGNCMCFEHAENIEVRDVTFLNASAGQTHALEYNAIKRGRVIDCQFLGYESYGKIAEAIQIDIAVAGSGNLPPADQTPCVDILVTGCMTDQSDECGYWGSLVGSHTTRSGVKYKNIRIVGNVSKGSLASGIRMHQYEEAIVEGNTIRNAGTAGILCETGSGANATGSNRNLISNNLIVGCGTGIVVAGVSGAEFRNMIVQGNIIRDALVDGINVNRSARVSISGNTVVLAGEDGIQVHNSLYCTISGNLVQAATRYGILGSPGLLDSRLQNNYVAGTSGTSMRVSIGSNGNLFSGNQIRRDGQEEGVYAISIGDGCTNNQVYGNDMLGTGGLDDSGSGTVTTATNRT